MNDNGVQVWRGLKKKLVKSSRIFTHTRKLLRRIHHVPSVRGLQIQLILLHLRPVTTEFDPYRSQRLATRRLSRELQASKRNGCSFSSQVVRTCGHDRLGARGGSVRSICPCCVSGSQSHKQRGHGNNFHSQILTTFRITHQLVETEETVANGKTQICFGGWFHCKRQKSGFHAAATTAAAQLLHENKCEALVPMGSSSFSLMSFDTVTSSSSPNQFGHGDLDRSFVAVLLQTAPTPTQTEVLPRAKFQF